MYNCPVGVLPNMDDMVVLNEWDMGMPYLPMHTDMWMLEYPHPNYVDGWYLWCDLVTKATYVVQTADETETGLNICMGNDVVVHVPYNTMAAAVDTTEAGYYEAYDEYDPDYNDGDVRTEDNTAINPWEGQTKYKVGYMWDNNGQGYMLGNEYHTYGWWCLDDCLWNMQLWDMRDEWHLRTEEEEMERMNGVMDTWRQVLDRDVPDDEIEEALQEHLGQLGLQMGGENKGDDAQHLERCLGA